MDRTRALALLSLGIALALFTSAMIPIEPTANASAITPIFEAAPVRVAPTPALPTAAPQIVQLAPEVIYVQRPPAIVVYRDAPAVDQAADMPVEAPEPAPDVSGATDAYLANVGAQAPHCIRSCDDADPPDMQGGPIAYPATDSAPGIILLPSGQDAPAPDATIAVGVPPISAEQAAIFAARQSNSCAPGDVFAPRSGCHTPGSGGPMPGAVGAP